MHDCFLSIIQLLLFPQFAALDLASSHAHNLKPIASFSFYLSHILNLYFYSQCVLVCLCVCVCVVKERRKTECMYLTPPEGEETGMIKGDPKLNRSLSTQHRLLVV